MKISIIVAILTLLLIPSAFSEGEVLRYLYSTSNEDLQNNKISYEILFDETIRNGDLFESRIYLDDTQIGEICSRELEFTEEIIFRKITCEVPELQDGEYLFVGTISREGQIIHSATSKEYILGDTLSSLTFEDLGSQTLVKISIANKQVGQEIIHDIPKEVLAKITDETKSIISSSHDFRILRENPIIAWDLDTVEGDEIEYRVQGNLDPEIKEEFKLKIQEKTQETKILEYILIGTILLILLLTAKPLFRKKK